MTLTFFLYFVIVIYGVQKGYKVLGYGDSSIVASKIDAFFDEDSTWSSVDEKGDKAMQFAFGISAYDGGGESMDDPRMGKVVARYVSWGLPGDGSGTTISDPIPMKECSDEDLGLAEGSTETSKFFPTHDGSIKDLNTYKARMKCFDYDNFDTVEPKIPDVLQVQADYNSQKGRQLKLMFEKCDRNEENADCATDEELQEWLRRKFLIVLENQTRF